MMQDTRVLIVEDEGIVARDIQSSLKALDYTVVGIASSGSEAVQTASETRPSLVLMDIRLKGEMNGMQAAEQIRARLDIPIVYLTAYADRETLARAKLTGPFGYVLKPFEERELQATIEMALYKHDMDKKLRESERWLAATLNCMGDAVIATDAGGRVKFMNPVAEKLTGWAQAEVLGKELADVFPVIDEETRAATENPVAQVLQEGVPIGLINHAVLVARDGSEIPIDDSAAPIQDGEGSVTGVVLVFRDITEHKRAERALRQYAERLQVLHTIDRAILGAQSPDEIARATLQRISQFVPCRRASVVLFDWEADQAVVLAVHSHGETRLGAGVRMSLEEFGVTDDLRQGEHHLVNDLTSLSERPAADEQLLAEGVRSYLSMPLMAQGELMGALNLGAGVPHAFSPEHVQVVLQVADQLAVAIWQAHLHHQIQRHARELAAVNKASQAIASTLDRKEVFSLVIAEVRDLLGAEGVSVLLLEPAADDNGEELAFAAVADQEIESLLGKRMPVTAGIAGWAVKEKRPVLVRDVSSDPRFYDGIDAITQRTTRSIMAVPLMVKGAASGVIEVVNKTDGVFGESDLAMLVTMAGSAAIAIENARLYQAEREQYRRLRQSQAQLIQVEKMAALGRLIASIAHEINNPLQAVQGCLTLAQEELDGKPRPDKLKRYLGMANDEIQRVSAIVRRMRDFYRPTREEFQSTDVCIVLNSVLELTAKQLQHSNVTVEREGFGDGSGALPTVWANPNHLKQVFLNLVLNAVDAMSSPVDGDQQGGTLRVRATLDQMVQQDHSLMPAVRIELSDTGQGMPPQVLSRLFEPFHTTKANGTGLGLAISYEIVRAHNGQISATSQVGVGTTFTVLLPVEQV